MTAERLVLEMQCTGPAPAGTLTRPDGTHAAFDGWLQLLAALGDAFDDLERPRGSTPASSV